MWAFIIGLSVLMWMWAAMSLHATRWLAAAESARLAVLVLLVGGGMVGLLALPWLVLPGSSLSGGWTRETLVAAQQGALLAVVATGTVAFLRAQRLLLLGSAPPASPKPPPVAATQRKRRH